MAAPAYCFTTLKTDMAEKPEELMICCNGSITAESAEMFQREVRDHSIPGPRAKGFVVPNRIVLDLSNVSRIDNAGMEALLAVWTASQKKSCSVEVINLGGAATNQASLSRLGRAFRKVLALFE